MIKFHIVTLGCSKNTADSEYVANFLQNAGLKWTDKPNEADLLMLNTCGFINDAKEQSLNTLFTLAEYKEKNKAQKLLVYGCLVKRYEEQLKADIPEIDYFFKFFDDKSLSLLLKELTVSKAPKKNCADFSAITKRFFTPPHIGLLRIAEGCDNWCSYCAIPKIRGSFRSLPEEEILRTAENLAKTGSKELSVIAQDTTAYGKDTDTSLEELLSKISQIDGIEWIRLHYLHPKRLTPDFIDRVFSIKKVLPYFDIPLQHIDDTVLNKMNRHTDSNQIKQLISHIRTNYQNSVIRSTFIVGFPGETDKRFERLLTFLEEYPIDRLGAFVFSPEEGTRGAEMTPKVSKRKAAERLDKLMTFQQLILGETAEKWVGRELELMADAVENGKILARTVYDAYEVDNQTILEDTGNIKPGDIFKGVITEAGLYDFKARPLK